MGRSPGDRLLYQLTAAAANPPRALLPTGTGCWRSQAWSVGSAALLPEGPPSCARLAEATQTHGPGALYRVLRALASVGLLAEPAEGCTAAAGPQAAPWRGPALSPASCTCLTSRRVTWRAALALPLWLVWRSARACRPVGQCSGTNACVKTTSATRRPWSIPATLSKGQWIPR